jgi:sodium transport system permease protein
MHALFTVFVKEFLENLRDRRTLISALLFGPLFGPILFGAMVSRMLNQSIVESDEPLHLTLSGYEHAPGLVRYFESQGVKLVLATLSEGDARAAVRNGGAQVVLIVPAEYADRFKAAVPAAVMLVADSADSQTRKSADRARLLLAAYGSGIAQLRLQIRGVSPLLAVPVAVNEIDVATPTGRAVAILGFMTYFVLFAVLMGGLYLAIDSTAGERERGSLEALLSLPVARGSLVGGKILATCAYMCMSLAISLTAFVVVFRFVPLERLGMSANLGGATALAFFAICLPFVPLGAALMTFVASFTRSYREAQTYLTTVLLVPTLPIAFREHLFSENAELVDVHPVTEPAFVDDERAQRRACRRSRHRRVGRFIVVPRTVVDRVDRASLAP